MYKRPPSIIVDILVVLIAAVLMSLPDYDGRLWPSDFFALFILLWRVHNRRDLARFIIPFAAFFLYLSYVLVWIKQYGWHWLAVENLMNSVSYALAFVLYFFIRKKLKSDLCGLVLPILFVIAEYEKSLGFFSFPWPLLSQGQYANLPFIQIAEFTGAWGVTFLLVWFNVALFNLVASRFRHKAALNALPAFLVIAMTFAYGYSVINRPQPEGTVRVSLFQRDVNTQDAWTPMVNEESWLDYKGLTLEEWSQKLNYEKGGFIVWPEGAVPDALDDYPLEGGGTRKMLVENLVRRVGKVFILGTQFEDPRGPQNTGAVFGPDGRFIGLYSKVHIVPFGEVIPLENLIKEWFPQYPWGSESLVRGRKLDGVDTPEGKVGILVCYESFFPDQVRRIVGTGCDYLFVITNTSWFGRSKASLQHAHYDVFRAIENRMWISRAATTGVSSFIDPMGRRYDETPLYTRLALSRLIYPREGYTLYNRWGDWFPKLNVIIALILLTVAVYRKNS